MALLHHESTNEIINQDMTSPMSVPIRNQLFLFLLVCFIQYLQALNLYELSHERECDEYLAKSISKHILSGLHHTQYSTKLNFRFHALQTQISSTL